MTARCFGLNHLYLLHPWDQHQSDSLCTASFTQMLRNFVLCLLQSADTVKEKTSFTQILVLCTQILGFSHSTEHVAQMHLRQSAMHHVVETAAHSQCSLRRPFPSHQTQKFHSSLNAKHLNCYQNFSSAMEGRRHFSNCAECEILVNLS